MVFWVMVNIYWFFLTVCPPFIDGLIFNNTAGVMFPQVQVSSVMLGTGVWCWEDVVLYKTADLGVIDERR